MKTYNLQSTEWIDAPSIFQWARSGYLSSRFKADKEKMIDVMRAWNLPNPAIVAILSGEVTPTITESRQVIFSF
jgi:hypothetical protein